MGRLADDMTRLVGEIQAARDDRRRLMRDLKHATVEMRRAVARLRSILASDAAGLRVAWPEPAGSTPDFGACGKPELDGDRPGQVEQRVASRLERRTP